MGSGSAPCQLLAILLEMVAPHLLLIFSPFFLEMVVTGNLGMFEEGRSATAPEP